MEHFEKYIATIKDLLSTLIRHKSKQVLIVHVDQFSNYFQLINQNDFRDDLNIEESYMEDSKPDNFDYNKEVYYSSFTYRYHIRQSSPDIVINLIEEYLQYIASENGEYFIEEYLGEELYESVYSFFNFDLEIETINPKKITDLLSKGVDYQAIQDDIVVDYEMQDIVGASQTFLLVNNQKFDI